MKRLIEMGTGWQGTVSAGRLLRAELGPSVGVASAAFGSGWASKWVRLGIHSGGPSFACADAEADGMRGAPAIGFELFF